MNKTIDECEFTQALAVLDKVDTGKLYSFDGEYMYLCDPWFLENLRIGLSLAKERYGKQ